MSQGQRSSEPTDTSKTSPTSGCSEWLAIGTQRCPSDVLLRQRGEPDAVLDAFCEAGLPDTIVEVAREGMRKTQQVLFPFVAPLTPRWHREPNRIGDDELPAETTIGDIPSWSLDMFKREGWRAFFRFLAGNSDTAQWVPAHIP